MKSSWRIIHTWELGLRMFQKVWEPSGGGMKSKRDLEGTEFAFEDKIYGNS